MPPVAMAPDGVRDLIAAGDRVVPRRLPHPHAIGERGGDLQAIAQVEAGGEESQAGDGHADAAARDRVHGEKDAAEKERGTEVLLKEEEHQRRGDADEDRKHVLASRQVDPRRQRARRG